MHIKNLIKENKSFFKIIYIIYLLIVLMYLSIFTTSFITYTVSADSNNYYVSTIGSNSYNGLYPTSQGGSNGPWATLEYAMSHTSPGDTVYILAGTYYDTAINPSSPHSGTAGNWITYTAYGNGEVILDATGSTDGWMGALFLSNLKYIRISHLTIRNAANFGILVQTVTGSSDNIMIDNCTIYNISEGGICFFNVPDVTVENCTLYDCENAWNDPGAPSQEVITFSNCNRFKAQYNTIYDSGKICIDAKASSRNGIIRNNKIDTSSDIYIIYWGAYGIYVDAGSTYCRNISIYNNVVWGDNSGYLMCGEDGGTLDNISLYNNIYNGTSSGFRFISDNGGQVDYPKKNIKVINNDVASGTYGFRVWSTNDSCSNLTIRNNIFECSALDIDVSSGIYLDYHNVDHNLFNGANSDYYGSNNIFDSPGFVDPDNGDFHLLSNSPAIDAGSSYSAPNIDFDGNNRPQGQTFDIGAFEFSSTYDNTFPQISDISIATSNPLDTNTNFGWENISCTITDNIEVDTVYIRIIRPNNNQINVEMTNIENSDCYYFNSSWSDHGNYSYYIRAIDTSGNNKYSNNFYFSLTPNWDINNDGRCSILDLILISNCYDEIGPNGWIREDIDNNGAINIMDMSLVSNHYNEIWYT